MSRTFKINRTYHGETVPMYKKTRITLNEGVTVLVGCNGIGKTTLMSQIKALLQQDHIPVISFDNLHDGGSKAISAASFFEDFQFMAEAFTSSEGENIVLNVGNFASSLGYFIKTGKVSTRSSRLSDAFRQALNGDKQETHEVPNERWILMDAADSGLSVDNIVEIKDVLFKMILKDAGDTKVYIVVSCNEYEMARGENCFDVYNGKYRKLKTYEAYRKFILKSREWKNQRYSTEQ